MAEFFGWISDLYDDVPLKANRFEVVLRRTVIWTAKSLRQWTHSLNGELVNRGEDNIRLLYHRRSKVRPITTSPFGQKYAQSLLRVPLTARVSSPFNLQRRHPVC